MSALTWKKEMPATATSCVLTCRAHTGVSVSEAATSCQMMVILAKVSRVADGTEYSHFTPTTFPLSYTFFSLCFFLRSIIHYFFLSARNFPFFPFSFLFIYFFLNFYFEIFYNFSFFKHYCYFWWWRWPFDDRGAALVAGGPLSWYFWMKGDFLIVSPLGKSTLLILKMTVL